MLSKIILILLTYTHQTILMSIKYRRSIIFDNPHQTAAKLALQTIVSECKGRLRLNSRANSQSGGMCAEKLTVGQAKSIEGLQAKLKTISFHTLYKQYHRDTVREEHHPVDPQKLQMFRHGKYYRCSQRPRREEAADREESRRIEMREYFQRQPEEDSENATIQPYKNVTVAQRETKRRMHSNKRF